MMPNRRMSWKDWHAEEEQEEEEKALHNGEVTERYRHFRAISHGYMGLCLFLFFMLLYVWVLGQQHRASTVGDANDSFQIMFELLKADLKVSDSATLYKFMSAVVIPKLLAGTWTNKTHSGLEISGRTTNEFNYVIGGLMITAKKAPTHDCFRGNPCYGQETQDLPFYKMKVPGETEEFSVPYNHVYGGYSMCLPSSTTPAASTKLLSAYAGLFAPDTRELWIHTVVLNPSGAKTVTSLAFGATISVQNKIQFFTKLTTIPYHWYEPEHFYLRIACEIGLIMFALRAFVAPLVIYAFFEPRLGTNYLGDNHELSRKWFAWLQKWKHLPVKGGRPLWEVPTCLYSFGFITICCWFGLGLMYQKMGKFGDQKLDWLFVDPLAKTHDDLPDMMRASLTAMHKNVLPFIEVVDGISYAYNRYFFLHVVVMTLMVMRLQQYFAFQKRLAVVADTFSGIFDDLLHMGIVMLLICFFFGVINSLAFGAYDPAFQNFDASFAEMFLLCFGLFKPAAGTPFVESLFKYTPHVVNHTEFMSWVPIILQILFKTLVILLLFKLLMGVVMEGYKKKAKLKESARTVREDLAEMSRVIHHYVWGHLILRRPYVPFFHVALALAQLERSKERPWEVHFLGLDHHQALRDALNAVLSDKSHRVQTQVEHYGLKQCGVGETRFVLFAYGMNRERAEVLFEEFWVSMQLKKMAKKDTKVDSREKEIEKQAEESKDDVLAQLSASRRERLASSGLHEPIPMGNPEKGLSEGYLEEIFKEYDILNIGTVDHRLMPQVFRQMGFWIDNATLANLLAEYDKNEDGDSSLKEFRDMIKDDRLIGLWRKPARRSTWGLNFHPEQLRDLAVAHSQPAANNQAADVSPGQGAGGRSKKKSQPLNLEGQNLSAPLLQANDVESPSKTEQI